jgi:hypothetical protein
MGIYNRYPNGQQTHSKLLKQKENMLSRTNKANSCTYRGSPTIKEKINTALFGPQLSTMHPEHVLISHRGHCFIINVQPNFPCVSVSVPVKNIDGIVPASCRFAVMIEHSMELVLRWL